MRYVARTAIKQIVDGKEHIIVPGKDVPADLASDYLVGVGAIDAIEDDEPFQADESELSDKPLAKQNKAELLVTAGAEPVAVPDGVTNAEIVTLIEAARLAKSQA